MPVEQKTYQYLDAPAFNATISILESAKVQIQGMIDKFNALNVGKIELKELPKFILDTELFISEKNIKGKHKRLHTLSAEINSMSKAIIPSLENKSGQLRSKFKFDYFFINRKFLDCYEFEEKTGKLMIKRSAIESFRKMHTLCSISFGNWIEPDNSLK